MALPAFYKTHFNETTNQLSSRGQNAQIWCTTFHFCLAKNLFIFSFDRLFVEDRFSESNFSIQGWARPSSQDILRLVDARKADEILGLLCNIFKAVFIKLPLSCCDQGQRLRITVSLEWRLTT
ncbi:hypothetical protein XENOCAPTIV_021100 [Xenoophorus captivus]|uniref:Uncharacterized protein n=1 Tax=Xenoophorus captivus TaxID=1517983 RepID=A0ABV0S5L1_9TELE